MNMVLYCYAGPRSYHNALLFNLVELAKIHNPTTHVARKPGLPGMKYATKSNINNEKCTKQQTLVEN